MFAKQYSNPGTQGTYLNTTHELIRDPQGIEQVTSASLLLAVVLAQISAHGEQLVDEWLTTLMAQTTGMHAK